LQQTKNFPTAYSQNKIDGASRPVNHSPLFCGCFFCSAARSAFHPFFQFGKRIIL
jgi:hypothetical protein